MGPNPLCNFVVNAVDKEKMRCYSVKKDENEKLEVRTLRYPSKFASVNR